jgi:radical SAM superfamily enzyme YgiQ (UPF0313 family)
MTENNQLCLNIFHCGNINPANPLDKAQKNIFFMPMGLVSLADRLKKNGVDVEIIHSDLEAGKSIPEILDIDTVDAVGFDLHWVNQSVAVMETAEFIKRMNPGIFIFLGGFTASLFAEEIVANYSQVDAVIRGDGEIPIVELAHLLQKEKIAGIHREKLKSIPNLTWKAENGSVTVNKVTYVGMAEEMNKLDFAAVDLLRNFGYYNSLSKFWTRFSPISDSPLFLLEVGRGCQYTCTFCGGNCVAQHQMSNRQKTVVRSIDSIISTIKKAVFLDYRTFYTCLEFEGSDQWYLQLFSRIDEENLEINYVYGCWRLPGNALMDALAKTFKNIIIEISPETANTNVRAKNKDRRLFYTNEQLEKVLDYAKSRGNIKIQLYFGYYLAGDTEETILETIDYIMELLIKYPYLLEIEYSNFSTDPGSLFFFDPEKYGLDMNVQNFKDYTRHLKETYLEKKGQEADLTVFRPTNISPQQDGEIRRKVRMGHYLFTAYRKSVSYVLKKTGSPAVIISIIKGIDIPISQDNTFPAEDIKEVLVGICEKMNVLDDFLFKLIIYEYKQLKSDKRVITPTPQWYLDFQWDDIYLEDDIGEVGSMMDFIKSETNSQADDKSLDIGFNFN